MNSHPRILWPQFVLLIALFILCLFAPDIWRSTGRLVHDSSPSQQDSASETTIGKKPLVSLPIIPQQTREPGMLHIVDSTPLALSATPLSTTSPTGTTTLEMVSYLAPADHGIWPKPVSLLKQLASLATYPPARSWIADVTVALDQLQSHQKLTDPLTKKTLSRLAKLVRSGNAQAEGVSDLDINSRWLRTVYALNRRLHIWSSIHQLATAAPLPQQSREASVTLLTEEIGNLRETFANLSDGGPWIEYLLLDKLLEVTLANQPVDPQTLNKLSCRVLNRIDSAVLTEDQRKFIATEPVQSLKTVLRQVVTAHVDPTELLRELEIYESTTTTQQGSSLASRYQFLRWSLDEGERALASQLDHHYRNANIRIAVSQQMINRLLPDPKSQEEPIDDTIQGARVSGKSRTSTILNVFLIPDKKQWRMGVQASGEVTSDTETRRRSTTFHNKGSSRYTVNKDLLIDRRGIRVGRATAKTDIQSELLGFETNFDSLPVVGSMLRSFVRNQYNAQADQTMKKQVERRARNRFDEEIANHLVNVENRFQERYLNPLKHLHLEPIALDLQTTTNSRLILRYRLAGYQQLAANTPRPRAPGNSLMSIQVHESAFNNTLQNLKLDGKRTDLRTLYREIAKAFDRTDIKIPEEIPGNVTVAMADHEAVRVRFEDGKVKLRIHLKELKSGSRHKWRNFVLTASYQPSMDQLSASLYRDGHLQFEGKNLRLGDRIALQGIFNKALPRTRPINMINKQLAESDGMKDLNVSQFVVRETWIGFAISAPETAKPRIANRRQDRSQTPLSK